MTSKDMSYSCKSKIMNRKWTEDKVKLRCKNKTGFVCIDVILPIESFSLVSLGLNLGWVIGKIVSRKCQTEILT